MAYTNIELRETNYDSESLGHAPTFDGSQRDKPPLHKRLLNLSKSSSQKNPTLKTEVQHDYLEQLLEKSDGTTADTTLREDYALFKNRDGVKVMESLILFKCFIPPASGAII